ncbi:hypothetical protein BBJ28_00004830 [Nothophytophthora sp. Chile5]|nr:hypothetical protein BBJ28_00004830 [Nothophytophthora sp. Chile5]
MPHIRTARAQQVAVPPASSASLELSRDDRQHLRAARRRAFERHQENAQWAFELLHGATEASSELSEAAQRPAVAASVESIERLTTQDREEHEAAQRIPPPSAMASIEENETKLLEPYAYVTELPGKNVRGHMINAFQAWLQAPPEPVVSIKRIVDELHNASLLIDDIEDDSQLRRGKPVAHVIFGVPATINCANYVYFLSLQRCQALNNPKALEVYTREMLRLHQGQGLDIFWRDHLQCPSLDEYLDMVKNKTGGLFRLAIGLMQVFSSCQLDFQPLVNALAVYFQVRDDYVNLFDEAYMENKSYCEDLTEGKFSYPLIVAIRENPQDTRLLGILKQRTKNTELKKYAVQYLRETGAVERTLAKLNDTVKEIRAEIASLGGNPALEQIVDKLHASIK